MSSLGGRVLIYGGRGALGSTLVEFLKQKNYVCLHLFSTFCHIFVIYFPPLTYFLVPRKTSSIIIITIIHLSNMLPTFIFLVL